MADRELWRLSATELSQLFDRREISPVEVVAAQLERCRAVNPAINAFVFLDEAGARTAAVESERRMMAGKRRGPLDGVPFSVKDNLFVAKLRATWGSRLFADFVPERDDLPVSRMRTAGAVLLGKTNTPEFALAGYTDNALFGPTRNPWDPNLTPGGSSGGAAASAAAGMCPIGLGTDAGGSIRRPSSYCGVVGLRPSTGRVLRRHGFPALASDLQVIGPIARMVADVALAYRCISAIEPQGMHSVPVRDQQETLAPRRMRLLRAVGDNPVAPEISAALLDAASAFSRMGHHVDEGPPPYDLGEIEQVWSVLPAAGLARVLQSFPSWQREVREDTQRIAERGLALPAWRYVKALDALSASRARFRALADFDVLLTPMSAALPWPVGEPYPRSIAGHEVGPRAATVFATFVNIVDACAVTLPAAISDGRLPVGLQLVAKAGDEELLLALAEAYQRQSGFRWPKLSAAQEVASATPLPGKAEH
jgi:aspartyl-tRNA(Asn)/glutamyl-tRNA(Gln) amidotransferase subunit A